MFADQQVHWQKADLNGRRSMRNPHKWKCIKALIQRGGIDETMWNFAPNGWGVRQIEEWQLAAQANNFNAVRLFLASGVIWTHCYWYVTRLHETDEILHLIGLPISHIAVNGFFFVSGFLICQSLFRQPGLLNFAAMRLGRLLPALIVCMLVMFLAFGLASGSVLNYLGQSAVWKFFVTNVSLIKAAFFLPSLNNLNEPMVANGSLWTIPWEFRCYVLLGCAYFLPAAFRKTAITSGVVISLAFCVIWILAKEFYSGFPDTSKGLLFNINAATRLWGCFGTGVAAALAWRYIPIAPLLLIPIWIGAYLEYQYAGSAYIAALGTFYTVLVAAFAQRSEKAFSSGWLDLSYGVYVYGFPVMVLIYYYVPNLNHVELSLLTLAITLTLAVPSWLLVEKPALNATKRIMRRSGTHKSSKQVTT